MIIICCDMFGLLVLMPLWHGNSLISSPEVKPGWHVLLLWLTDLLGVSMGKKIKSIAERVLIAAKQQYSVRHVLVVCMLVKCVTQAVRMQAPYLLIAHTPT